MTSADQSFSHMASSPATVAAVQPRSTRSNFHWTLLGNVISAGCTWGMFSLIAKIGSPAMVGQYALALAITTPIVLLASAPRFIQITAYDGEFSFGDYTLSRLLVLAAGIFVVGVVGAVSHYDRATLVVIGLVMTAKVFDSLSDGAYALLQQHEVMDRIAQSRILQGFLQVAVLGAILVLTHSIIWAATAVAVASAYVTMTFDARSAGAILTGVAPRGMTSVAAARFALRKASTTWTPASCWRLSVLAAPAAGILVMTTVNSSLIRYLVERKLGAAELGLFVAMTYCGFAGLTVINALGQALIPPLARRMRTEGFSAFWSLLLKLIGVAAAAGAGFVIVAAFWGGPLMTILYTRQYAGNKRALVLIAIASAISYLGSALGYGLAASRYLTVQVPLNAAATVVIFVLGLALIRSRGIEGAAITMILTATIQAMGGAAILLYASITRPVLRNEPKSSSSASGVASVGSD